VRTYGIVFFILFLFLLLPSAAFEGRTQTVAPAKAPAGSTASSAANPQEQPPGDVKTTPGTAKPAGNTGAVATATTPVDAKTVDPSKAPGDMATDPSDLASAYDPLKFKISQDGTVATILFDRESVEAMRSLITQLEQAGHMGKVKGIVYSAAGFTPMLILLGEQEELLRKVALFKKFMPDQSQAHMVVIGASLRELMDDDATNIGLTLSPDIMGATITTTAALIKQSSQIADYTFSGSADLLAVPVSNIVRLQEALDRSKVLVSSEVYTRNGTKALLTNVQQVPIFSTDSNKNVMTSYQQLETSVDVIPTTVDYRKDKPEESQVRVDVLVKISVITGTHSYGDASAPEYTTKTFATTRILKANSERYVVGTFVNDAEYKTQIGLPYLSRIPVLRYLFSRDLTRSQRAVAILTLSVKLLPLDVKSLTIDVEHVNPLEKLYQRKGRIRDAK